MNLLIKNCNLYSPTSLGLLDVLIENGNVVKIDYSIESKYPIIDCKNKILLPNVC